MWDEIVKPQPLTQISHSYRTELVVFLTFKMRTYFCCCCLLNVYTFFGKLESTICLLLSLCCVGVNRMHCCVYKLLKKKHHISFSTNIKCYQYMLTGHFIQYFYIESHSVLDDHNFNHSKLTYHLASYYLNNVRTMYVISRSQISLKTIAISTCKAIA